MRCKSGEEGRFVRAGTTGSASVEGEKGVFRSRYNLCKTTISGSVMPCGAKERRKIFTPFGVLTADRAPPRQTPNDEAAVDCSDK